MRDPRGAHLSMVDPIGNRNRKVQIESLVELQHGVLTHRALRLDGETMSSGNVEGDIDTLGSTLRGWASYCTSAEASYQPSFCKEHEIFGSDKRSA